MKKFILVKFWDFEIDENFPKIIPPSFADGVLPQNVTKITYTVELSGIPHKPIRYQPFEPESTEGEYDPVEKWIISKIRLGKSIDYLLSLPSEQSFFNFAYEIQDWPAGTLTKWHELVEKCSSFLKIGNKSCWSTVSERIYANGYDKQILIRIVNPSDHILMKDVKRTAVSVRWCFHRPEMILSI